MEKAFQPLTVSDAIRHWWDAKKKNSGNGTPSQGGSRDSNLAGNTMDGFRDLIIQALVAAGVDRSDIFSGGHLSAVPANLPSYFRASKNWDVIVCKHSIFKRALDLNDGAEPEPQLILAIEFKSQEDSIGNNQNNRMEESIGNAADFWASYENGNFAQLQPRPWLGFLFVGKYQEKDVTKGVDIKQPHFRTDPAFDGTSPQERLTKVKYKGPSYAERYRIFLERMVAKKFYDGVCFITTNEEIRDLEENHRTIFPQLSGERFLDLMTRHVKAYYFD